MKKNLYRLFSLLSIVLLCTPGNLVAQRFPVVITKSIDKEDIELMNAKISLPGGRLYIGGNNNKLATTKFTFSDNDWEPFMDFYVRNGIGNLNIEFDRGNIDFDLDGDDEVNRWDIELNKEIPTNLDVKIGGGIGRFDLAGFNLNEVEVTLGGGEIYLDLRNTSIPDLEFKGGAGEATVDLTGERNHDLDADFTCGFGELTIKLPSHVNIDIHATGILGEINHRGLMKDGNHYYSPDYDDSGIRMRIDVVGGMGELNLIVVD